VPPKESISFNSVHLFARDRGRNLENLFHLRRGSLGRVLKLFQTVVQPLVFVMGCGHWLLVNISQPRLVTL